MAVVDVDVSGAIGIITVNRPEVRNAINPEVYVRLQRAWQQVRENDAIRVAILTGAGSSAFCAGADLQELIPLLTGSRPPQDGWDHEVLGGGQWPGEPGKPVIAAVNGYAVAGGMELVMNADLRVAVHNAKFGLQEVKWGLFPTGACTVRLPRQ